MMIDYSFFINGFSLIKISGYIDPGSFTAIIAMIIGGIAGAGMTLNCIGLESNRRFQETKSNNKELINHNLLVLK